MEGIQQKIQDIDKQTELGSLEYEEVERIIINTLEKTIGMVKIRRDKKKQNRIKSKLQKEKEKKQKGNLKRHAKEERKLTRRTHLGVI